MEREDAQRSNFSHQGSLFCIPPFATQAASTLGRSSEHLLWPSATATSITTIRNLHNGRETSITIYRWCLYFVDAVWPSDSALLVIVQLLFANPRVSNDECGAYPVPLSPRSPSARQTLCASHLQIWTYSNDRI